LPVVGLYYSLRWKSFLTSVVWTLLTALVLPLTIPIACSVALFFLDPDLPSYLLDNVSVALLIFFQIAIAGLFAVKLFSNLKHRRFALEKTGVG
ncbi:MAG TPA: hypothetical protein VGE41_01090, partial [Verrucomicrobiae bacterium]